MNFLRNKTDSQQSGSAQPAQAERVNDGPIITVEDGTGGGKPQLGGLRRLSAPRSRLENIAFWVIGVAIVVAVVLFIVPSLAGAITTAIFMSLFVAFLTLANLNRPSGWANGILGRSVFPVLHTTDAEIRKLTIVNSALVFIFSFTFELLARYITPFFAGIVVFGALIALGVFWGRARNVVNGPKP